MFASCACLANRHDLLSHNIMHANNRKAGDSTCIFFCTPPSCVHTFGKRLRGCNIEWLKKVLFLFCFAYWVATLPSICFSKFFGFLVGVCCKLQFCISPIALVCNDANLANTSHVPSVKWRHLVWRCHWSLHYGPFTDCKGAIVDLLLVHWHMVLSLTSSNLGHFSSSHVD